MDRYDSTLGDSAPTAPDQASERMRDVFDRMFGFVAVLAPDGRVLEANGRAVQLAGGDRDGILGQPLWEGPWWADDDGARDRIRTAVQRTAQGAFERFEVDLRGGAGRPSARLDFTLTPTGPGDAIQAIIAEGRDTALPRDVEQALRLSEAKFAGIINIASDAIISTDDELNIVHFNRGAEAIFGYSAAEAVGRPLDNLIPERFRAQHRIHMRRFAESPVAARRMGERQEIAGLRRSGEEFPAEASISKIQVGGALLFTVVLRDATDRRRTERAQRFLALAGQRLAASLDLATTLDVVTQLGVEFLADCCVIYDAGTSGTVRRLALRHVDPAFAPLMVELRNSALDPRDRHPVLAVLDTGVAELIEDVSEAYLTANANATFMRLFREIGVRSAILVPLIARDDTVGVLGLYSAARDRRYGPEDLAVAQELASRAAFALENARLYQEARDAIQARDDVLAVVSHDLGNPLSAIRIGTSLLLRSVPPEERGRGGWAHLEGIRQSTEQMERLVNDLLEIKRIEAGHLALERKRHSAETLVSESVEMFQTIADDRGLVLSKRIGIRGVAVHCDRERLLQVFSNLIGNALKFTPEGGHVEVYAQALAGEVIFSVRDTGRGIAPEHLPHVFDRFWRAQRAKREGIGLGLAIAKGIVQAHGGRIWAESVPGAGSTFSFALPLQAGEEDAGQE